MMVKEVIIGYQLAEMSQILASLSNLYSSVMAPATPPVVETTAPSDRKVIRIVIVLDESGSMSSVKTEIIQAVNKFVAAQQELKTSDECLYTLIKFNSTVNPLVIDQPLAEVKPLQDFDYNPDEMTALYDAIGFAFTKFEGKKDVVLVVVTDGDENSSKKYNQANIKTLIEKHKDQNTFAWNIIYLAADPMLQTQGDEMGMSSNSAGSSNVAVQFTKMSKFCAGPMSAAISGYRQGQTRTVNLQQQ